MQKIITILGWVIMIGYPLWFILQLVLLYGLYKMLEPKERILFWLRTSPEEQIGTILGSWLFSNKFIIWLVVVILFFINGFNFNFNL